MLRANATHMKDLDLKDLRKALKHVGWKSFRGADLHRAKGALQGSPKDIDRSAVFAARAGIVDGMKHMRRDHDAERRNTARGRLDRDWRRLQAESHGFDLAEKGSSGEDPMDTHSRTPREEAADLIALRNDAGCEAPS